MKISSKKNRYNELIHDFIMIILGVIIAIILSKIGFFDFIINLVKDYYFIACFITGIFFTSIFTIAPASVALIHLSDSVPMSSIIIFGALGAMCGDLILFFFIRDRFSKDIIKAIKPSTVKHLLHSFHFGFLKWLSPIVGALIIASPLPDEFGITLLGMSRIKTIILIPISFIMNSLGIYILLSFSHFI